MFSSRKMAIEGSSLVCKVKELRPELSLKTSTSDIQIPACNEPTNPRIEDGNDQVTRLDSLSKSKSSLPLPESRDQRHLAAVKLQKVYKSFRTRRQLADCAVLVEQRWWKLLDFAELKRTSISFFDIEKPETALTRWSRAKKQAAKVGKGLSKDERARKLALQHWLEAIDPRHRYGHNLQFYYAKWLHCMSSQPFFYWLDIGEGKEVSLERCSRSKLHQQCIKYLGPTERTAYEVVIENRKLMYKQSGELLDTSEGPKDVKWIFVLSASKTLFVGQKKKGTFQHSSFLAGGATLSAGRLIVENGVLKAVWPHSGHYLPTQENFQEFMSFLEEHNVDLSEVQVSPCDEEEEKEAISKKGNGGCIMSNQVDAELPKGTEPTNIENLGQEQEIASPQKHNDVRINKKLTSVFSRRLLSKIKRLEIPETDLEIPETDDTSGILKTEGRFEQNYNIESPDSSDEDGYETAEDDFFILKTSTFDEDEEEEENEEITIPKEKIMRRIDSHKGIESYQLAEQLSSKWSTGAGPRISCMRDYPSELQFCILEQANLSPSNRSVTSSPRSLSRFSPRISMQTGSSSTTASQCRQAPRSRFAPEKEVCIQQLTP